MDFNKSRTKTNLARVFTGECLDGARYQFIAKQATADGFSYISDLFKTLAKNEMAHARVFYDHLIKNSKGDLSNIDICAGYPFDDYDLKTSIKASAGSELSESKNIYPAFAKVARDEGYADIADSFELVAMTEECHFKQLSEIDDMYQNNCLYTSNTEVKWKCSNCGHEHTGKSAWKTCPLCGYPQGYVMLQLQDN